MALSETREQRAASVAAQRAYVGEPDSAGGTVVIEADGERWPLPLREGGSGYAWGRAGAAPRELARAILLDATGNEMLAERLCRPLTWELVAELPRVGFRLTRAEVLGWIDEQADSSATAA